VGEDCGAAAFFHNSPLYQIRRTHVVVRALGDGERVETGVGISQQRSTQFGKLPLRLVHAGGAPLLRLLAGRRLPPIHEQGVHLRPGLGGHFLVGGFAS
jgi:hypothetical protein